MFWLIGFAGLMWFGIWEYIRGRPNCPAKLSFWLTFIGPVGAILLIGIAFILKEL
jgi:hypothetical protein